MSSAEESKTFTKVIISDGAGNSLTIKVSEIKIIEVDWYTNFIRRMKHG